MESALKYSLTILVTALIVGGGVYLWQRPQKKPPTDPPILDPMFPPAVQVQKNEDIPTASERPEVRLPETRTYADTLVTFQYPAYFTVTKKSNPDRIIINGPTGHLDIFQLKSPTGNRAEVMGFEPGTTPPTHMTTVEDGDKWADVWMYYDKADIATRSELDQIANTIVLQ
jgi:hypothetical protein